MNRVWIWAFGVLFLAAPACAAVLVTLDEALLQGMPGQTVSFAGFLTNTTGDEVFLTSVNLNTAPELVGDPSPFFAGASLVLTPAFSLSGGQTTNSFLLFEVLIPLGTTPGSHTVNNDFRLLGGLVAGDQFDLANVSFTVEVVPEPATCLTLLAGLVGLAALRGCRRRG